MTSHAAAHPSSPTHVADEAIHRLRAEANKALFGSLVATGLFVVVVAGGNFAHAFVSIDGLTFADLDHVIVVSRYGGIGFWPIFWLSVIVVPSLVFAITFWRYLGEAKRAKRLSPILIQGRRAPATVVDVSKRRETRGNTPCETLTLVAEASDGTRVEASREVDLGSELPTVAPRAAASLVTHEGATLVVVGDEVFEASAR